MRVQRILGRDLWLVLGVSLLLATSASAQVDTGSILGTVKDRRRRRASRRHRHHHP